MYDEDLEFEFGDDSAVEECDPDYYQEQYEYEMTETAKMLSGGLV